MTERSTIPVRRAQLIAPFGVGAMMTNQAGISMICASLDNWYAETISNKIDESEFVVEEWRLKERLGVDHFRIPPDYRRQHDSKGQNAFITVPAFRFPQWHFCPKCDRMRKIPLTTRGQVLCQHCEQQGNRIEMYQVRFVMICDHGHISDFPWREWVHRDPEPNCNGTLKLDSKGGGSLSSIYVRCSCGMSRSLSQITRAEPGGERTHLSSNLSEGADYTCPGTMPWAGVESRACSRPVRGSLRNASNVYFAEVRSSLYLPRSDEHDLQELIDILDMPSLSLQRSVVSSGIYKPVTILSDIRKAALLPLKHYSDEQIVNAMKIVCFGEGVTADEEEAIDSDSTEIAYRRSEFNMLGRVRNSDQLTIRDPGQRNYDSDIQSHFSRIMLVDRLRETRALTGFTRIQAGAEQGVESRDLLWSQPPKPGTETNWLPVSVVHGEGVFFEFNEEKLREWEEQNEVKEQFERLNQNFRNSRFYDPDHLDGPRFVLIHTFAHLLMNQLVFECGYSTASLRERLYISTDENAPMGGVLIYTAAGDSEGTMGGLVRMGKPGNLEPVIRKAITNATWCAADPICMEAAKRGGQGPESCNLAACHNCALVPETSCEEFNRFLDRGHVVGVDGNAENSYFRDFLL